MCSELREATIMEGNNAYLPHEIIINILKRLPVKSLIRFQCVCKNWKSLLKDALFIADHLHHSSHRPSLLLPRCYNYRRQLHLYSLNCDYRFCKFDTSSLIDYLSSLTTNVDPYLFRIAGSSNGLLCVLILDYSVSPHKLLVWNPATKEVREVPTRTLDFKSPDRFSIGFGFSTIANDYRIVNISVSNKNRDYRGHVDRAEVYSLGTGLWKVEFGSLLEGTRLYCGSSTGDGIVFWVGQKQSDRSLMIVSFDLTMEEFRFIPMPPLEPMLTTIPTFYENKPAIISYNKRGTSESGVIHLWVIEENTWTKIYSGCRYLHPYNLIPLNIWRNEIVFRTMEFTGGIDEGRSLYSLNPATNEFKKFVINDFSFFVVQMLNYVESLVPIGNLHIQEP